MTTDVRIARISPAGCLDHADVVLATGAAEFRVRVDAPHARAIMAELAGLPSEFAMLTDLLRVVLDALHSPIVRVEIAEVGSEPYGRVLFEGKQGLAGIGRLPPGVALMLAARLHLPIALLGDEPAAARQAPLPAAIHEFLRGLDFGEDIAAT